MKRILTPLFSMLLTCFAFTLPTMAQTSEMEQDLFENLREGDKAVVVAVHEGTLDGSGIGTYERINQQLRQAYPNYAFREAWTSRSTFKQVPTPDELLSQLQKEGYTHVLIQSSDLTDGINMQCLRQTVEEVKGKFKHIRLGEPLLSSTEDYEKAVQAASIFGQPKVVNVFVCADADNGNATQFAVLDYTLRNKDMKGWHVATIEGLPTFAHLLKQLKSEKAKKVHLIPFLLTNDNKAALETLREWQEELDEEGYKVSVEMHYLGELDDIISLFCSHIRHAEKYRRLTAREQKLITR